MFRDYLHWQYVSGPRWLLQLYVNLQLAILRWFSVSTMLKTLFAHWHRDRVSLKAGSISGIALALAWNAISRGIGFIIRSGVLLLWLLTELLYLPLAVVSFILFLLWPWLVVGVFLSSCLLLVYGY